MDHRWVKDAFRCSAVGFGVVAILKRHTEIRSLLRRIVDHHEQMMPEFSYHHFFQTKRTTKASMTPRMQHDTRAKRTFLERRHKTALLVAFWIVTSVPYRFLLAPSSERVQAFPDIVIHLTVCVALTFHQRLGERIFEQILTTLMWVWCFTLAVHNVTQLNEINNIFGLDLPVVIGICSPFHVFVLANLFYTALFMSFQTSECFDLLAIFVRSLGIVYLINVLNFATSGEEAHVIESAQSAENVVQALSNIIEALCDCTVHLTRDLHISKPSPKLASFLNLNIKPNQLEGEDFLHFVPFETDRNRFRNAMQSSESAAEDANELGQNTAVMHFNLSDASGTPFEVKVVHTCVLHESGSALYILGICGIDERMGRETAIDSAFGNQRKEMVERMSLFKKDWSATPSTADATQTGPAVQYSLCNSWCSSQKLSNCSSRTVPDKYDDEVPEAILEINISDPCTIICASVEAEKLLGMTNCRGKPFINSIVDADAFCWWLKNRINWVISEACVQLQDFFGTQIRLQHPPYSLVTVLLVVYFSHPDQGSNGTGSSSSGSKDTVAVVLMPRKEEPEHD